MKENIISLITSECPDSILLGLELNLANRVFRELADFWRKSKDKRWFNYGEWDKKRSVALSYCGLESFKHICYWQWGLAIEPYVEFYRSKTGLLLSCGIHAVNARINIGLTLTEKYNINNNEL